MSGAPIISGTNQLPKPPNVAGITEKKIISRPCEVTIVFHTCPLVTMVLPGTLSCARMISDRMPPTTPPTTAKHRYSVPMSLWLVLHSQRTKKLGLWS